MSYSSVILGDAPVAYWRLQETSGTTAADSNGTGTTYPGTYYGSPAMGQASTGVTGDTSVDFLSNQYVSSPATFPLLTKFSVEVWCNWTGNYNAAILSDKQDAGSVVNYEILPVSATALGFRFNSGSGWQQVTVTVPVNAWNHLVMTYDGATIRTYLNGSATGTLANSTTFSSGSATRTVYIGAKENGGTGVKANIQEVAIYQTVLSATQVSNHYNAATSSNPTPITASASFQGQGSLSATANIVNPATINATASFTGQGSLTAAANLISPVVAMASMQGQGSLTATGNGVWLGSASLTGQGSLSSNPVVVLTASASLSGQGSLTAVVELQDTSVIGTANFYGSSSVVSNPAVSKAPILATANMQGQGSLTATVEVIDIGVANLQGTSYLMANAVLPSQVQVPKVWNVVFDPKKSWTGMFDKTVHIWTVVFDPKKVWVGGE